MTRGRRITLLLLLAEALVVLPLQLPLSPFVWGANFQRGGGRGGAPSSPSSPADGQDGSDPSADGRLGRRIFLGRGGGYSPLLTPTLPGGDRNIPFRRKTRRRYRNGDGESGKDGGGFVEGVKAPIRRMLRARRRRGGDVSRKEWGESELSPAPPPLVASRGAKGAAERPENDLVDGVDPSSDSGLKQRGRGGRGRRAKVIVTDVEGLREAVLDRGVRLRDVELRVPEPRAVTDSEFGEKGGGQKDANYDSSSDRPSSAPPPFDHEVLHLIARRARDGSKPGSRPADDRSRLALSIEGGGMRGAVSAGMASAVACLGLCDSFDAVYGSSAGSIVGAYMISRQMHIDVYTQVLTAAKKRFVCVNRLAASVVRALTDAIVLRNPSGGTTVDPGMNISFVLDDIMSPDTGVRPLDLDSFRVNDAVQPLRVVSSSYQDGRLETVVFGSEDGDFFDKVDGATGAVTCGATEGVSSGSKKPRRGLFACLQAGMTVPAAAGAPVDLIRSREGGSMVSQYFDAFCFEPIPYRSAVAEGATHVLALRSRPDGFRLKTVPTVYETVMTPLYFEGSGMPEMADFFREGGQQYIYAEDLLTLDEGREDTTKEGVAVPPPRVLYGIDKDDADVSRNVDRSTWERAHLLPIAPSRGTPELSVLSTERDEVLRAVRDGFAAAFDLLAPAAGVEFRGEGDCHLTGARVAELVFPDLGENMMGYGGGYDGNNDGKTAIPEGVSEMVPGDRIDLGGKEHVASGWIRPRGRARKLHTNAAASREVQVEGKEDDLTEILSSKTEEATCELCSKRDAATLLSRLPGIRGGKLRKLAEGLHYHKNL